MRTRVVASTKVEYKLPVEEAIDFSNKMAGISCVPNTINQTLSEHNMNRINSNINSNFNRDFGHAHYSFKFAGIPKIMAMILNNEGIYCTSQKFAKTEISKEEKVLYEKWLKIYERKIHEEYQDIDEKQVKKLAQENARYLISVFSPATVMEYSVSFQQFSYILHLMEDYTKKEENSKFNKLLSPYLKEFVELHQEFKIQKINPNLENRQLSLFTNVERKNEWGENYCCSYWASFVQLAQAQRYRNLKYEILTSCLDTDMYFVPHIILDTDLEDEWLEDISSLSKYFPQGKMVFVNERGTVEDFVLKCEERLSGFTQLEITMQTKAELEEYLRNTREKNKRVYNYLMKYATDAKGTFPDYNCVKSCIWKE